MESLPWHLFAHLSHVYFEICFVFFLLASYDNHTVLIFIKWVALFRIYFRLKLKQQWLRDEKKSQRIERRKDSSSSKILFVGKSPELWHTARQRNRSLSNLCYTAIETFILNYLIFPLEFDSRWYNIFLWNDVRSTVGWIQGGKGLHFLDFIPYEWHDTLFR